MTRPNPEAASPRSGYRWSFVGLLCLLTSGWVAKTAAEEPSSQKSHIVIIFVDDMGYGDPGCYNPESKIATPNIDRLAREGMRFTDAHAPGAVGHPSRYGLLTGRYPFRTDVSVWPRKPVIEEGRLTIASLLRSNGYRTAMVGKWHLGFLESGYDQPLPGGPVDRVVYLQSLHRRALRPADLVHDHRSRHFAQQVIFVEQDVPVGQSAQPGGKLR